MRRGKAEYSSPLRCSAQTRGRVTGQPVFLRRHAADANNSCCVLKVGSPPEFLFMEARFQEQQSVPASLLSRTENSNASSANASSGTPAILSGKKGEMRNSCSECSVFPRRHLCKLCALFRTAPAQPVRALFPSMQECYSGTCGRRVCESRERGESKERCHCERFSARQSRI
jgi:hypothetical protein